MQPTTTTTHEPGAYPQPRRIRARVRAQLAAVGLLPGVDADVPGDLLLVGG